MYKPKSHLLFVIFCLILLVISLNIAFVDAKQYVLKLGHDWAIDAPIDTAAKEFAKIVEEKTNGNVKVEVYPASQLGSGREMIEQTQLGVIQGVILPTPNFSGFDMSLSILELPFLFPSVEKTHEILDGDLGKELAAVLEQHQLIGVAWWESGFKQFTANFKITHPDDYIGKKIRVMASPLLIAQFEAYGASAIPVEFAELYNALQQGVVDGQENSITSIYTKKLYEVQDYMVMSNHGYTAMLVTFSKTWMDDLPEDYRQIIIDAAREITPKERAEIARLVNETYLPEITKHLEVLELTEEGREAFREKAAPVYEIMRGMLNDKGKILLDKFLEETS